MHILATTDNQDGILSCFQDVDVEKWLQYGFGLSRTIRYERNAFPIGISPITFLIFIAIDIQMGFCRHSTDWYKSGNKVMLVARWRIQFTVISPRRLPRSLMAHTSKQVYCNTILPPISLTSKLASAVSKIIHIFQFSALRQCSTVLIAVKVLAGHTHGKLHSLGGYSPFQDIATPSCKSSCPQRKVCLQNTKAKNSSLCVHFSGLQITVNPSLVNKELHESATWKISPRQTMVVVFQKVIATTFICPCLSEREKPVRQCMRCSSLLRREIQKDYPEKLETGRHNVHLDQGLGNRSAGCNICKGHSTLSK